MKTRTRVFGTAILCAVAVSANAQEDAAPPVPSFLQGLTPWQLNSKPIQRLLYNYSLRANVDGSFPDAPGAVVLPQINALSTANVTAFPYVLNSRWTSLGPQPITGGQVGNALTTRPMSGRVASLAVHPTNGNRWLVGTANGGLWETRDGGANFVALTDAAPSLAVGAVSYAASNPNIIYIGTGEASFSGVSFGGEGVLKSTDGGVNWKQLATATFFKGTAFSDLRVDPVNANVLVAATSLGIYGRPATRPAGNGARGLWRSTDGGATWTQTLAADGIAIAPSPANFAQQYAGLGFGANVTSTVQRSVDGGATWASVPGPWSSLSGSTDRTEVVIAPSNPNRVYVAISNSATAGMFGLWTSANAWSATPTWVQINLAATDNGSGTFGPCAFDKAFNSVSPQCWYNMTLTVKPTDENILFFGGIPVWRYNLATNAWVEVSQTAAPANRDQGIHVDQHASAWSGSRLIIGNDGGVWSTTTDGDGPWATHNATLATAQYYEGSVQPDGSKIIGGSQDNGTHQRTASNAWPLIFGGDGAGNISSSANNIGVSSQNQGVARSTNGGASFVGVRGNYGGTAPFIGKMRECPAAPGTVILNGSRVNIATNFYLGPAASLWTNGGFIFTGASAGSSIAFGNNCNTIAAGHSNGEIRITATGDITQPGMIERDTGGQVPNRPISSIVFDPNNSTKVCVGLAGFAGGAPANIYCTNDFTAGTPTWTNLSVPVDVSINALVYDPTVANRLYAGSDFGVWVTSDAGASWAHWGPGVGMPNVPVFDLVARGGKLVAFTHGRGAFVLSNFDLNTDTVVSCADVSIVKAVMGKKIGDLGFNVQADLNSDNVINIRDLAMVTRQLPAGTSCS
jgi:hypothetical protein